MSVTVNVPVEDIATVIVSYDQVRIYSATSPEDAFTNLAGSIALVAGTKFYSLAVTGTANTWFRTSYRNSSSLVESDQSPAFLPNGITLLYLIAEAAREVGACAKGTCTATGTVGTLIDATLLDNGVGTDYLEGFWLYRPDAALSTDKLRRIDEDGFSITTGALSPVRDWTNAPASGEVYYAFGLLPPYDQAGQPFSWARAAREGLRQSWYTDELDLGVGTSTGQTRFSLSPYLTYVRRDKVGRVLLRTTDDNGVITDTDARRLGRYVDIIDNGRDSVVVDIHPAPATDESVIVEVWRRDDPAFRDADVVFCPFEKAKAATVWQAYVHLININQGRYQMEAAMAYDRWLAEGGSRQGIPTILGV